MGAKRTRSKRRPDHGRKAEFIRQHPELSAKAVVEAAAKAGIAIHLPQVYNLRAADQQRSADRSPPAPAGPNPAAVAFRKLVLELGVQQARCLIDDVERKLEALVAGR